MWDLTAVKNKLTNELGLPVEWSKSRETLSQNIPNFPAIFLGYIGMKNQNEEVGTPDIYEQRDNDIIQVFETQIITAQADLPANWKLIFNCLSGWNPMETEVNYSSISWYEGGVMGLDGSKIWWADRWRIGFPKANPF
jgi:hypothetical protein